MAEAKIYRMIPKEQSPYFKNGTGWKGALTDLKAMEKKGIPHFSILQDWYICKAIIADGGVYLLTDDAKNIHIFGFYECLEKSEGEKQANCQHPSNYRLLYDTGLLFKGMQADIVKNNEFKYKRGEGSDWNDGDSAIDELFIQNTFDFQNYWYLIPKDIKSPRLIGNMYDLMAARESYGYYQTPFLYSILDVDIKQFDDYVNDVMKAVTVATGILSMIFPAAAIVSIATQAASIGGIVNNFVQTGNLSLNDLSTIAESLAPTLLPDKTALTDLVPDSMTKYVDMGNKIYSGLINNNAQPLMDVFGIDSTKIQSVAESIQSADIYKLAEQTGKQLAEVEKIANSMNNNQMAQSLLLDGDRIIQQSYIEQTALKSLPVQQLLINSLADMNAAENIPGAVVAVQALIQNDKINLDEYKGLLNFVQKQDVPEGVFDDLGLNAMIERARNYAGKTFVLPSNIPDRLQEFYAKEIIKALPMVNVVMVSGKSSNYSKFSPAFI